MTTVLSATHGVAQGGSMARLRHQSPPCAVLPMYLRRHRPRPTDRERRSATCPALPAGLPTAAAAGASLGLAAVLKLCGTGRVLGISGTIRGAVFSKPELWRFAFLTGMASGALWAHRALGAAAFLPLPATYSYVRAIAGGLLVGFGATLGNGCTSGHGICGNSRLSPRSMAHTVTAMAAGGLTAAATGTLTALGGPATTASASLGMALNLLVASAVVLGISGSKSVLSRAARDDGAGEALTEVTSGFLFSLGLALSGMTLGPKVAAFLSFANAAWDPTLAAVMAGALLVSTPLTLSFLKTGCGPAFRCSIDMPRRRDIDARLLAGAALFGAGWGLSGFCPGPAFVNLAAVPGG